MKATSEIFSNRLISLLAGICFSVPYSLIAYTATGAPLIALLLVNALSAYLLLSNLDLLKTPTMRAVYIVVGFIKFGLLIFNATTKSLFFTGVDWGNYDRMAKSAIENSHSMIDLYSNSFDLFVFFVATIYQVFGAHINLIFFFALPLSFILFRYVYKSVSLLTNSEKRAGLAALLVIVWPANIVFSVSVLREIAIQVLVAMSFYHFIRHVKGQKGLLKALVAGLASTLMHSGMIVIPLVYAYCALQGRKARKYRLINIKALIAVGAVLVILIASPLWSNIGKQFASISSPDDITDSLEIRDEVLSEANTNYISSTPQNTTELALLMPYRGLMFAFSPFPWQVYSLNTLVAFVIDALPQAVLLMSLFLIIRRKERLSAEARKVLFVGVALIVLIFAMFSLGTNNYGTAMRHRLKVLPIGLVLTLGFYQRKQREKL